MITTILLAAVIALGIAQLLFLIRLSNQVSAAERVNAKLFERFDERLNEQVSGRLTHFAEALTLLTDTTEHGLTGIAATLAEQHRKSQPPNQGPIKNPTRNTTRRIVAAVKGGKAIAAVAATEQLSESEVRLHVELGGLTGGEPAAEHGALRS